MLLAQLLPAFVAGLFKKLKNNKKIRKIADFLIKISIYLLN